MVFHYFRVEFDGNATPTPLWKLTEVISLQFDFGLTLPDLISHKTDNSLQCGKR